MGKRNMGHGDGLCRDYNKNSILCSVLPASELNVICRNHAWPKEHKLGKGTHRLNYSRS